MSAEAFYLLIYIWIGIGLVIFFVLLKITAPYGRHTQSNWGPMISNKAGWILMELPTLIIPGIFYFTGTSEKNAITWILYLLYTFHYVNRVMVFPFRIRTKGKQMPVSIVLMAICFNVVNGFILGYFLGNFGEIYTINWLWSTPFILGFIMFVAGMAINMKSDNILIKIRAANYKGYKIPQGGLFKYLSCPNLFGEIIEWIGFAIMTWNIAGASFAIWTITNLIPRAIDHHKWYQEKYPDYPYERKAIIPFVI